MKKNISILGSTGSIGTQAVEVVQAFPELFNVKVLAAGSNSRVLIQQAVALQPEMVFISTSEGYKEVKDALQKYHIRVLTGEENLLEAARYPDIDMVLVALVGFAAVQPTVEAIRAGRDIALASKEVMVVAGNLIMQMAEDYHINLLPVDSEHSAIFQCLVGEQINQVDKIYLTASGGPFLQYSDVQMQHITPDAALKHPNWEMGNKITIDSASLMNKGLEVIEAKWLFGLDPEQLEVIIHPQSVIHSLVQFKDGVLKAQMGTPDMRLPILYAFSWPDRYRTRWPKFDFSDYPSLTFERADQKKFRNLALSFEALRIGGNMPCVLNAANEVVVSAFLEHRIEFLKMPDIIEETMHRVDIHQSPGLEELQEYDELSRRIAAEFILK
jgi:1-deoxy-D-xylulose-5-phosphate reductoisomerase